MTETDTSPNTTPDPAAPKRKFSRGIRPDHIARGEALPLYVPQEAEVEPKLGQSQSEPLEITRPLTTDNKPETKWQQTEYKTDNKPETKWQQTDNDKEACDTTKNVTGNKPSTQPTTQPETKWQQTGNKPTTELHFSSLVGLQKEIILFIYNRCKISRSKETGPVTLSFITSVIKTTENSAKVTLQRLEKKNIISRVEFKNGRGGWARFELKDSIYREMLQIETDNKPETKWQQTDSKPSTQPTTEPATSVPIVVVPNLNSSNTTNTQNGDDPCFVIPNELSGKVSRRQLSEFVLQGKITESDLQLSLDAFAYDLKNKLVSSKYSSNPVALLIGAIKNNGSYNSAKYVEALKSELKPFIQAQRETTAEKTDLKNSTEWSEFQKFKSERPEEFRAFESKMANFGFKGDLLEDFTFLEFKKSILQINEETNLNPLRPVDGTAS